MKSSFLNEKFIRYLGYSIAEEFRSANNKNVLIGYDTRQSCKEIVNILSEGLYSNGFKIFSGGTDTHLLLLDLRDKKITGKLAEESLGRANITCNKNGIPFDTQSPMITSGIRLGTPAGTTRGFGKKEFDIIGKLISTVLNGLAQNPENNSQVENDVKKEVIKLCTSFPIYSN